MNRNGESNVSIAFFFLCFLLRQNTNPASGKAIIAASKVKIIICSMTPINIIFSELYFAHNTIWHYYPHRTCASGSIYVPTAKLRQLVAELPHIRILVCLLYWSYLFFNSFTKLLFFYRLYVKILRLLSQTCYYRLSSYREVSLLLVVVMTFHHIFDLPFGFDLFPAI